MVVAVGGGSPPNTEQKQAAAAAAAQIILLRLCVGESVMTSLHWVEFRFLVAPPPAEAEPVESRCSAISSEMKVFRSTSWSPLRLLRHTAPEPEEAPPPVPPLLLPLTCVGDPGAPERTLILAMAPLRPGWRRTQHVRCSDSSVLLNSPKFEPHGSTSLFPVSTGDSTWYQVLSEPCWY